MPAPAEPLKHTGQVNAGQVEQVEQVKGGDWECEWLGCLSLRVKSGQSESCEQQAMLALCLGQLKLSGVSPSPTGCFAGLCALLDAALSVGSTGPARHRGANKYLSQGE